MTTLEERVQTLERRCRRLTAGVAVMLGALGVGLVAGADRPKEEGVLRARGLEVVDAQGQVRISLGPADEGYGVVVNDAAGAFRATMTDAPGGAVIQLRKEGSAVKLMANEAIGPFRAGANVTVSDARGGTVSLVAAESFGTLGSGAMVAVNGANTRSSVVSSVDTRGEPQIRIMNEKDERVFVAPAMSQRPK